MTESRRSSVPGVQRARRRKNALLVFVGMMSTSHVSYSLSTHVTANIVVGRSLVFSSSVNPCRSGFCRAARRSAEDELRAESTHDSSVSASDFEELRRQVVRFLQRSDFEGAKELICGSLDILHESNDMQDYDISQVHDAIDQAFQAYFNSAFAAPFRGRKARVRIELGLELLQLQLSSESLAPTYNSVQRRTLVSALRALTNLNETRNSDSFDMGLANTDAAFRLLQRLVSGIGVRNKMESRQPPRLYESDFNMVLNAYSSAGRMDMAHRIVALQERTPSAPELSPVSYSILLKGYGRLGDLNNIEMIVNQAGSTGVAPDTIMLNSLIDAYISCDELDKARDIFEYMRKPRQKNRYVLEHQSLFVAGSCPPPNQRTCNIFLKALAKKGLLEKAVALTDDMRQSRLWDHVTTNTLVQAAVNANEIETAERLLDQHAASPNEAKGFRHPNLEAYTTIMDAYAKRGKLQDALALLKRMKDKGVEPNEYTYTCLVGVLARERKLDQAQKMMAFMKASGLPVRAVTYNSLISGLVHRGRDAGDDYNRYVDEAIAFLRKMMRDGVRPNVVTLSVIIDAFGQCYPPRITEAVSLTDKLQRDGIVPTNNTKIQTALVQAYGVSGDLSGAIQCFKSIHRPDVAAVNAFLDACIRCGGQTVASKIFKRYFEGESPSHTPDVISYSVMISSELTKSNGGLSNARNLYEEMKFRRRIMPDNALIDIILKGVIEYGKNERLVATDVRFVASVLRDAKKLSWGEGQLERRKQAIQTVMTGRIAVAWEEEAGLFGLLDAGDYEDEVFRRHGWNKVDSGFRLWGASEKKLPSGETGKDDFFQSKGWNNVNSGFRII